MSLCDTESHLIYVANQRQCKKIQIFSKESLCKLWDLISDNWTFYFLRCLLRKHGNYEAAVAENLLLSVQNLISSKSCKSASEQLHSGSWLFKILDTFRYVSLNAQRRALTTVVVQLALHLEQSIRLLDDEGFLKKNAKPPDCFSKGDMICNITAVKVVSAGRKYKNKRSFNGSCVTEPAVCRLLQIHQLRNDC